MKCFKMLALAISTIMLLTLITSAFAIEEKENSVNEVVEALPDEAGDVLSDINPTDLHAGENGLVAIWENVKKSAEDIFKSSFRSGARILLVVILCTLGTAITSEGSCKEMIVLCSLISVSAIALTNLNSLFGLGVNVLHKLSDFSKVLLPTMCTAAVSAGAVTSAAAKFAATSLFVDILITVSERFIVPLITMFLATSIGGSLLIKSPLGGITKFIGWLCKTAITLLVTSFTFYLGISGLVTGKADEVTVKAATTVLGTAVPVVGGIISKAAGSIVAGAGMIRNAIGVFGLLGVLAVCAVPFLTLGLHYLTYKAVAAISEAVSDKRMSQLIGSIGTAFGMLLALVGVGGIMLFFSLISSMRTVSGI